MIIAMNERDDLLPEDDDEHGDQGKQEDRLADAERGRAFLKRLRRAPDFTDASMASEALYLMLYYEVEPEQVAADHCAALGRVLRGSE